MASTFWRAGSPTATLVNMPGRSFSPRLATVACTMIWRVSASTEDLWR